jgi:hypothetical protein
MDFVIDFFYAGDGDAIVIWGREPGNMDVVFFVDGGHRGNGQVLFQHYRDWIKPHLYTNRKIIVINSHPHEDHIDGLLELVNLMGEEIDQAIYNDPVECIGKEHKARIYKAYMDGEIADISDLYDTFEQVEKLNALCKKYKIKRLNAYAENCNFFNGSFRLLSPYKEFYIEKIQHFTDVNFLRQVDLSRQSTVWNGLRQSGSMQCNTILKNKSTSPENLTSTVIQLTDSKNRKYILTADAGTETFDFMEAKGFEPSNIKLLQLPHHGSRHNISSTWIRKFNPERCIVSAEGGNDHPCQVVASWIKRNMEGCEVYSTHTGKGKLSYITDPKAFPPRNWELARPL